MSWLVIDPIVSFEQLFADIFWKLVKRLLAPLDLMKLLYRSDLLAGEKQRMVSPFKKLIQIKILID